MKEDLKESVKEDMKTGTPELIPFAYVMEPVNLRRWRELLDKLGLSSELLKIPKRKDVFELHWRGVPERWNNNIHSVWHLLSNKNATPFLDYGKESLSLMSATCTRNNKGQILLNDWIFEFSVNQLANLKTKEFRDLFTGYSQG